MKLKILVTFALVVVLADWVQAAEQRGALVLNKIPIYEFEDPRKSVCIDLFDVKYGQDVPDMRDALDNRNAFCQGRYEMTVRGKPGRTVTLYAQYHFGKQGGFLVVRKTDDRQVWISDLEDLPSGRWTTVPASRQSGGYQAFYREGPAFDQNISSVKWGQWWPGKTPE